MSISSGSNFSATGPGLDVRAALASSADDLVSIVLKAPDYRADLHLVLDFENFERLRTALAKVLLPSSKEAA